MTPILIVIPFWKGDMPQAIELCKVVAGLQPNHVGAAAHVMLACRQDCVMDPNMIKIISAKFNTLTYKTASPLRGWPAGSNGMFGSTMIHVSNNLVKHYECVYWMEPDAIPLCPNWFTNLVNEWRKRHPSVAVMGCRHDCDGNGKGDHITGCAVYHPNIARIYPPITSSQGIAWDYQHRAKIVAMGKHTPLIENFYKQTKAAPGIVDRINVGVNIIHGFKDYSVINHVKKKYHIK